MDDKACQWFLPMWQEEDAMAGDSGIIASAFAVMNHCLEDMEHILYCPHEDWLEAWSSNGSRHRPSNSILYPLHKADTRPSTPICCLCWLTEIALSHLDTQCRFRDNTKCTCPVLNDTPIWFWVSARGLQPEGGYARQKWCICPEGFQTGLVHV
jgi:hypothetical protein